MLAHCKHKQQAVGASYWVAGILFSHSGALQQKSWSSSRKTPKQVGCEQSVQWKSHSNCTFLSVAAATNDTNGHLLKIERQFRKWVCMQNKMYRKQEHFRYIWCTIEKTHTQQQQQIKETLFSLPYWCHWHCSSQRRSCCRAERIGEAGNNWITWYTGQMCSYWLINTIELTGIVKQTTLRLLIKKALLSHAQQEMGSWTIFVIWRGDKWGDKSAGIVVANSVKPELG